MANIAEPVNPGFPPVYLIDLEDDVIGGPEGISNRQGIQLAERTAYNKKSIEQEANERTTQASALTSRVTQAEEGIAENKTAISFLKGRGGYLTAYDFGSDAPSQQELTDYALAQITNIEEPVEIWDGTRVKNLFNNHVWVLNNTQNTDPPIFEWCDNGSDSVDIANNEGLLGLVTGEVEGAGGATDGFMTVQSSGKMKLIGFEKLQKRIVGEYRHLSFDMDEWELATNRLLKLNYQIIEIALYPELFARMYCGDANNNTAYWWYKCDHLGNRTVTGLYMRVEDGRGMFYRGAGANAVLKGANSTPYDGGAIGSIILDATRNFYGGWGHLPSIAQNMDAASWGICAWENMQNTQYIQALGPVQGSGNPNIDLSREVPTAHEVRPASISALMCISY